MTYDPDVARLIETMNRVPRARFQGQTVEETREAYRLSCRIGGLPAVAMASYVTCRRHRRDTSLRCGSIAPKGSTTLFRLH